MASKIKTLENLFLHMLQDMFFAENHIAKTLPRMAERSTDATLKQSFDAQLEETVQQIKRLDEVFKMIGEKAKGEECAAIEGIVKEYEELISEIDDDRVRDAATLASAQAVEHYQITRYGTLIALAKRLGHADVIAPLQATLAEEKAADAKLTELSESVVLREAA